MTTTVGKMFDGKIVEIVRTAKHVQFSDISDWIMICTDWQQPERKKQQFKWVEASSTRFEWVRTFSF